jgi:DNA-binding transcriptional LysR family regulator
MWMTGMAGKMPGIYARAPLGREPVFPMGGIVNLDIKRSDLPLLISLDVLLEERNVTRAASRLNLSQSALSGQLARLRDMFGDPLLVPSENGRGMVLTQRAHGLHERLGDALSQLRHAVHDGDAFDPQASKRTFVVATNDSVFTILGLTVVAAISRLGNPGLKVAIVPAGDPNLVERMARGEVDLFLGDTVKVPDALKARFLLSDPFVMAQRIGHPRGAGPATLEAYCALPQVIVSQRGHFHSPVDDMLASRGQARDVTVVVPSYNQVALVLAQTDAVATLPGRLLERYRSLIDLVPLPFDLPAFALAMAWHPRSQHDDGLAWLRDQFVTAAGATA